MEMFTVMMKVMEMVLSEEKWN